MDPATAALLPLFAASPVPTLGEEQVRVVDLEGAAGDGLGSSLGGPGDVDGDGLAEVVAGAPAADEGRGAVVVLWGGEDLSALDQARLLDPEGAAGDALGTALAGAGDVDGDGYRDLLVGAPGVELDQGAVLLVFGPGLDRSQRVLASAGQAGDRLGWSVAGGADLDGDGRPDAVAGAPGADGAGKGSGAAWVLWAGPDGLEGQERVLDPSGAGSDALGWAVAAGGDLDGDGFADLAAGAPGDDGRGVSSGTVLVALGGGGGIGGTRLELSDGEGDNDDQLGWALAAAGDLDGDGYADLVAGAQGAWSAEGVAVVFFGGPAGPGERQDRLFAWDGSSGAWFGSAVAAAGDLDADGLDDLVLGARNHDLEYQQAGAAYIVYGAADGTDGTRQVQLHATDGVSDDGLGTAVAGPGDIDGDGAPDLVAGAPGADHEAGALYLFPGVPVAGEGSGGTTDTGPSDTGTLRLDEDTGTQPPPKGCRCSATGGLSGLAWLVPVGLLVRGRRR